MSDPQSLTFTYAQMSKIINTAADMVTPSSEFHDRSDAIVMFMLAAVQTLATKPAATVEDVLADNWGDNPECAAALRDTLGFPDPSAGN